jgi:hypothetical protein
MHRRHLSGFELFIILDTSHGGVSVCSSCLTWGGRRTGERPYIRPAFPSLAAKTSSPGAKYRVHKYLFSFEKWWHAAAASIRACDVIMWAKISFYRGNLGIFLDFWSNQGTLKLQKCTGSETAVQFGPAVQFADVNRRPIDWIYTSDMMYQNPSG